MLAAVTAMMAREVLLTEAACDRESPCRKCRLSSRKRRKTRRKKEEGEKQVSASELEALAASFALDCVVMHSVMCIHLPSLNQRHPS